MHQSFPSNLSYHHSCHHRHHHSNHIIEYCYCKCFTCITNMNFYKNSMNYAFVIRPILYIIKLRFRKIETCPGSPSWEELEPDSNLDLLHSRAYVFGTTGLQFLELLIDSLSYDSFMIKKVWKTLSSSRV